MTNIIKVFLPMSDTTVEVNQSTDSRGYKMICIYDIASGEQLQRDCSPGRPRPVPNVGPTDILHPTLQLQEVQLVSRHEPAWLKSDLILKPIDSFFD